MCKINKKWGDTRMDPCMEKLIENLNMFFADVDVHILACCCGHGKYPMSIIVRDYPNDEDFTEGRIFDLCSNACIPRKRKFYKKDKQGFYYIPECVK